MRKFMTALLVSSLLLTTAVGFTACDAEAGPQGEPGIQGEKGEAGAQGEKGDKGDKGDTGAQGIQGEQGLQGEKGDKGDKGDTGAQGIQGEQGLQGEKGDKGDKGDTGAQGIQGEKGDTGLGISKVEIINGALVITYTDGSVVNAGNLSGVEGTQGLEYYPLPDGTYGVKMGTTQYLEEITIPATYNGVPVTQILESAFYGASNLKKITIPDSVISIDSCAFYNCSALSTVLLGNSVTSIRDWAFYNCTNLKTISLPHTITFLGEAAFYNCSSLNLIEYNNAFYFGNNENPYLLLYAAKNTDISECMIHKGTMSINRGAFQGCSKIKNIFIPNSVVTIGSDAFYESGLEIIEFENQSKLQAIGTHSFEYTKIELIKLPESLTTFNWGIFSECLPTLDVIIPTSVTSIKEINDYFGANNGGDPVRYILYMGTPEQWNNVEKAFLGGSLMPSESDVYFYSETNPGTDGNYWRYVEDVPIIWE